MSLYSVSSLTSLTKRTLADYTPSYLTFSSSTLTTSLAAAEEEATFLPDIIQAATPQCQAKCHVVSRTLAGCLRSGADYDILKCSCSDATLARVYTCADCITLDPSNMNETLQLQNYNAFVNQCISLSLSNSSQLYQIKGQPLTIATPTTTLVNPSATIGSSASVGRGGADDPAYTASTSSTSSKTSSNNAQGNPAADDEVDEEEEDYGDETSEDAIGTGTGGSSNVKASSSSSRNALARSDRRTLVAALLVFALCVRDAGIV
ncbi:hypothetical protein JCM10212_001531 [Sporobolomyces blumeae]